MPFKKGNLKGTETDWHHVPKDELVGLKASLTEQRALSGSQGEKERFSSLEKQSGNLGGLQGCCEILQGENEKGQSPDGI